MIIWIQRLFVDFFILSSSIDYAQKAEDLTSIVAGDKVLGKENAPITIIEYASLTCSHCADFHKSTFPQVKKEWIETGKAKFIFRDFPLDNFALAGSMIAHCVPDDRYFAMLSALFETQENWIRSKNPAEDLKKIAKLGGVSDEQFPLCLKNEQVLNHIQSVQKKAQEFFKIEATPTFVINGKNYAGSMDYDNFRAVLEKMVKK